jgi:hypothetical protein
MTGTDGVPGYGETEKAPDHAATVLAFRVWRYDGARAALASVNAGRSAGGSWIAQAISHPAGEWPAGELMFARCGRGREHEGRVPDPACSCGIYATTELAVANDYLDQTAPVLGLVELGGKTISATQGYRAAAARVAAILLIDEAFTLRHKILKAIAEKYQVPALVPHSTDPEEYRRVVSERGPADCDWRAIEGLLREPEL